MIDVYLGGKRVKLDPRRSIGKGGEADVFAVGKGRALKVFKTPDHPDYAGSPREQQAAEARLAIHQQKLRAFPTGLPPEVMAPEELATDSSGLRIVGYAMRLVPEAEPLLRYADPVFRRSVATSAVVVELFRELHRALSRLHAAGVVIGDFNDLNVLVTQEQRARLIDADSFQFAGFACSVFTERFVDPLLCEPGAPAPRLTRPYGANADWYAFAALFLQSLLFVGPYGGVFRPDDASRRVPHAARPLHRITVFHPDVRFPRAARCADALPDALLGYFRRVFEADERGPFPHSLFDELRFVTCARCGLEHARVACPLCQPGVPAGPQPAFEVRGKVACTRVFETSGVIVHASLERGDLRCIHHEAGAYRRDDGALVLGHRLEPGLRFAIHGSTVFVGRGTALVALSPDHGPEQVAADSDGSGPAFTSNGRHRYWCAAGRLLRDAPELGPGASEAIGDVLEGQTRIWAGTRFGFGLYRASNLAVAFTFDAERRGIDDRLALPRLDGELTDAACFSTTSARGCC